MRILFPTAEAAPLYKVGGLGDVAGSLPLALIRLGHDVRLILPRYEKMDLGEDWKVIDEFEVIFDHKLQTIKVWEGILTNSEVPVYLMETDKLAVKTYQDYQEEIDYFACFSMAVSTWLSEDISGWQPQVIHCHDWQTALIPLLLEQKYLGANDRYKSLLTIHNIAYKGVGRSDIVHKLGLNANQCQVLSWDMANGDVDILMEGIIHADKISTVSPTYAQEILTPEYGMELEPVLQSLSGKLSGILNGLDLEIWNPQTDTALEKNYSISEWRSGKSVNKIAVQKEVGLAVGEEKILIGFVGRLDPVQKGVGLLLEAVNNSQFPITNNQIQLIVLGTGDPRLEDDLRTAASQHENFAAVIKFDGNLARRIYAGCDFLLVPSKYEPCGLIQMIAMRYGTIPIVRATGGLRDTVKEDLTGFLFPDYSAASMMTAVTKAVEIYQDQAKREEMVRNGMGEDFSWNKSAEEYVKLYEELVLE